MASYLFRRPVFQWALYDWANSAYATTVMVVFFPLFFRQTLNAPEPTFWLGVTNGTSSLVLALLAPWLGALADKGGAHTRLLMVFTALGVIPSALLAWTGQWWVAALLFGVSSIAFWGGLTFYDSMLSRIAPPEHLNTVSGFGYAFGYLGGAVLLTVNVVMFNSPSLFGLEDKEAGIRASFLTVAVWWTLFALPLFKQGLATDQRKHVKGLAAESFRELKRTFGEVRKLKPVIIFLLAYWMYIDGVNTVMKMAVEYGLALGFPADSLIKAILLIQVIGFPTTWIFGLLGDRISPMLGIFVAIAVYCAVTIYAVFMTSVSEYYVMAVAIGCVQGAIQAMSRSYFTSIIPKEKAAEFFGFYNMMGKFASVLGPIMMGTAALLLGDARYSILALLVLFVAGAAVLVFAARAPATVPN